MIASPHQTYRMIALDVDGTIATSDHVIPQAIIDAIRAAMNAGAIVSLVTGRMRRSALKYAQLCGANGPTVSYQGGIITAPDFVTDTYAARLPLSLAASSLQHMRVSGAHINCYVDDEIYVEDRTDWAVAYAGRMQTDLNVVESLDSIIPAGPTIVMAVDKPELITHLAGTLRSKLGTEAAVTQSLPHFCEVAPARATKASGLSRVCNEYGIAASEVIAIGDGEGDVSMIQWAGLGVGVGDAHPEVIASADLRIDGPDHNGVAELIQKLLRQGKLGG
jgi:Cof subfamily protein (haloacid dehalogenase superfamily)